MISPRIEEFTKEELHAHAMDYLVELLHKVSMTAAGKYLLLYVPTLQSALRTDNPTTFSKLTAAHIIFMVETNIRIGRLLATNPRLTSYYKHPRHAVLNDRMRASQESITSEIKRELEEG